MTDKYLIIGGGTRLKKACDAFCAAGYDAAIYDPAIPLKTAIDSAKVIILGLPASTDDIFVTGDDINVALRDVAMLAGRHRLVLGGRFTEKTKALFDIYSVRWADYALSPEFEVLNAVPTAEGAIQIAMEEFPFTLHSSKTLVTGFGRVARALALRLKALGSDCTIAARSRTQRAEAESLGFRTVDFTALMAESARNRILFNTVPAPVFGREHLSRMTASQGIIDLASKPGGVDLDAAKTFGVNVIWALSLPGKVAPETAGEIIQKTVCNIVFELGL